MNALHARMAISCTKIRKLTIPVVSSNAHWEPMWITQAFIVMIVIQIAKYVIWIPASIVLKGYHRVLTMMPTPSRFLLSAEGCL
jgi:hypothetical protein